MSFSNRRLCQSFLGGSLIYLAAVCTLLSGCSEPTSAPASDRSSTKSAVFKSELDKQPKETKGPKVPASGKTLAFVHPDHFGLISIDVPQVVNSPTLSQVAWPQLETLLQDTVGTGSIESIERIWVVLDREFFSLLPTGDESQNPMVIVIDQKKDFDLDALATQLQKSISPESGITPFQLEVGQTQEVSQFASVYLPTPTRLITGSHAAVAKLTKSDATHQLLVDKYYHLDPKYLTGVVEVESIRPQLKTIFDMIGSVGPMKDYVKLPDALKQISLQVDLDSDQLASLNLRITDKPLAQLIANAIQSSGSGSSPMGAWGMGGMLGGGGFAGMQMPVLMYDPQMQKSMESVATEIAEKQLMSVRLKDQDVRIKLKRPGTLDEFVSSIIEDQQHMAQLLVRQTQAQKIAVALQAYEQAFGHLPPAGLVTPDEADEKTRAQFNWLTGILPELGHQDLYEQFEFSLPHDHASNWKLVEQMPDAFGEMDGMDGDAIDIGLTRFRVLGGKALWGDGSAPKLNEIEDRTMWTALVGESNHPAAWTDPNTGLWNVDQIDVEEFGQPDENGWLVINAKFQVRIVVADADAISAITSAKGGEKMKKNQFIQTIQVEKAE